MESQYLDEWEADRVAAAFGLETFERERVLLIDNIQMLEGKSQLCDALIEWQIHSPNGPLHQLRIYQLDDAGNCEECFFVLTDYIGRALPMVGICLRNPSLTGLMVRGIYCLGLEDVLPAWNYPLTAHEKLELRLSLPREFWPKTWLDEEDQTTPHPKLSPC